MSDILISFVMPVYNVEAYLGRCLSSVASQCGERCEMIIVNDGSTDGSGDICDNFQKKHPTFIRVVHQQNAGLSDARNIGMSYARGTYVCFIDTDDFIEDGSVKKIIEQLKCDALPDLVFLQANKLFSDGQISPIYNMYKRELFLGKSRDEVLRAVCCRLKYPGSAWAKLIKRSLIENNNICFASGKTAEDLDFVLQLLLKAESFDCYEFPFYFYRQNREGSITYRHGTVCFEALHAIVFQWLNAGYSQNDKPYVDGIIAYEYVMMLFYYAYMNKDEKLLYKNDMRNLRKVLRNYGGVKYFVTRVLLATIGINATARLIRAYAVLKTGRVTQ